MTDKSYGTLMNQPVDRPWFWDGAKQEYYDDYGNRFSIERLARLSDFEVREFLASFPKGEPEPVFNHQGVIDYLAQQARLVAA